MELIIINENKIKITMTKSDMDFYGLDENEFHCSLINTREILNKILKNNPAKTSFENVGAHERLLLQLYPEKGGGCELFVTKIPIEYGANFKDGICIKEDSTQKALLPKSQYLSSRPKTLTLTYSFKNLDDLISACKIIIKSNLNMDSQLYISDLGIYYLFVYYALSENEKSTPSSYLSEYGELENSENTSLFLREYGKCVCKKEAIETLANF